MAQPREQPCNHPPRRLAAIQERSIDGHTSLPVEPWDLSACGMSNTSTRRDCALSDADDGLEPDCT